MRPGVGSLFYKKENGTRNKEKGMEEQKKDSQIKNAL